MFSAVRIGSELSSCKFYSDESCDMCLAFEIVEDDEYASDHDDDEWWLWTIEALKICVRLGPIARIHDAREVWRAREDLRRTWPAVPATCLDPLVRCVRLAFNYESLDTWLGVRDHFLPRLTNQREGAIRGMSDARVQWMAAVCRRH